MASRPLQLGLVGPTDNVASAADTTYTKIFVGGLAWETQRNTMRHYFEQFGDILEAVVITEKNTGRSKGYGFVTFKDADSAMRACQDPSPVIDGRRANCNLACLGAAQRPRPPTPQYGTGTGTGRFRPQVNGMIAAAAYRGPSVASAASTAYYQQPAAAAAHYALQPYSLYGYSAGYSQENNMYHPMNYFGGVGQQQQQFTPYYPAAAATPGVYPGYYPYYYAQYSQSAVAAAQAQTGFGLHYPQMLQYNPYLTQAQFGGSTSALISLPPPAAAAASSSSSFAPPTAGVNVGASLVSGPSQPPPPPRNGADQHALIN